MSATARACVTVCTCESPMAHARVNVCITGGVRQAQEGAIASAGARAVVEAMREHPAHAAIQRKGCARLLDLTPSVEGAEFQRIWGENGGERMEMDRKYRELASAGVIDVVCQALSTQPAEVAATGCRVLTFLARSVGGHRGPRHGDAGACDGPGGAGVGVPGAA